jgi:hypothetical protein
MDYREILNQARTLSRQEQEQLTKELAARATPASGALGMLTQRGPAPQSVAWLKSERGHAVLATDTGPSDSQIPAGAAAIAGMWADRRGDQS